jgi:hypothetical protein
MERWIDRGFAHCALGAATAMLAISGLCGCAALMPMPDVSGLAEPGNVLNGYITAESTVELNRANEQLSRAQAQLVMQQAIEVQVKREELKQERPATIGILRDMASAEHQPLFADLAQWVAAGGDPNYAMNYALTHQNSAAPRPNPTQPEQNNVRPTTISHSDRNLEQRNAGRVLTARVDAGKKPNP